MEHFIAIILLTFSEDDISGDDCEYELAENRDRFETDVKDAFGENFLRDVIKLCMKVWDCKPLRNEPEDFVAICDLLKYCGTNGLDFLFFKRTYKYPVITR